MQNMLRKVKTVLRVFKDGGVTSIFQLCLLKLNSTLDIVIEHRGSMRLDHCNFRLDSPVVSPHIRRLFFFNRYERPERRALERFLDPKLPVVELGSAVGVIACLANKKLHDPYRHVAVEANPDLLPLLRENRRLNDCHFTIMHRALAYGSREKTFYRASNYLGSNALKPCGIPIQVRERLDRARIGRDSRKSQNPDSRGSRLAFSTKGSTNIVVRSGREWLRAGA